VNLDSRLRRLEHQPYREQSTAGLPWAGDMVIGWALGSYADEGADGVRAFLMGFHLERSEVLAWTGAIADLAQHLQARIATEHPDAIEADLIAAYGIEWWRARGWLNMATGGGRDRIRQAEIADERARRYA
jgi:hypothetical protein